MRLKHCSVFLLLALLKMKQTEPSADVSSREEVKSLAVNEIRLKSSSIYNQAQTLTEELAACVVFDCVKTCLKPNCTLSQQRELVTL